MNCLIQAFIYIISSGDNNQTILLICKNYYDYVSEMLHFYHILTKRVDTENVDGGEYPHE